MELSNFNIKKFLMFSQKKKKKKKTSYISGSRNTKKILYISGNGTFLYFKRNFQSPKNNFFLYFSKKSYE